jgi:hypothetical protein
MNTILPIPASAERINAIPVSANALEPLPASAEDN